MKQIVNAHKEINLIAPLRSRRKTAWRGWRRVNKSPDRFMAKAHGIMLHAFAVELEISEIYRFSLSTSCRLHSSSSSSSFLKVDC